MYTAPEAAMHSQDDELLDVLTKTGERTGISKPRRLVHRDGDYHRAVHVWIYSESTQELLLQRRADCKDSWPGQWDISSAGHISAGDSSLLTARKELHEELGISLPKDAFELIFVFLQECVINDGNFINNEYNDVYLVTTLSPIPQDAFLLQEFELWSASLTETEQKAATGFFSVIKRHDESNLDSAVFMKASDAVKDPMIGWTSNSCDLFVVPYSCEYREFLVEAAELLKKAAESTDCSSLKKLLEIKAKDFLTNDYYESDVAWMELDSKLDVTIGPYETYEDAIFGYKATFEAFIGIRDDIATSQVKLFGDHLQTLQENLPLDNIYKAGDVVAAPIRVINLIYNAGDVKGPQTVAFNLPNDERIVNERGTSMVMLKNISESKFKHILQPIANICISEEQKKYIDFESFFTHTICHECCHGIGPHTICLPCGQKSTVRLELQELHSALEEAKADIVGLWALRFLINQELLPRYLLRSMYVSFLAGCFRSVRFGLEEAHGKGQALQFNWLYDKQAFILHPDGTFSVDFKQVEAAVEDLSREILIIQARGDKAAARSLLQGYAKMTQPLSSALEKLEKVQVPVDISPIFGVMDHIMDES